MTLKCCCSIQWTVCLSERLTSVFIVLWAVTERLFALWSESCVHNEDNEYSLLPVKYFTCLHVCFPPAHNKPFHVFMLSTQISSLFYTFMLCRIWRAAFFLFLLQHRTWIKLNACLCMWWKLVLSQHRGTVGNHAMVQKLCLKRGSPRERADPSYYSGNLVVWHCIFASQI